MIGGVRFYISDQGVGAQLAVPIKFPLFLEEGVRVRAQGGIVGTDLSTFFPSPGGGRHE